MEQTIIISTEENKKNILRENSKNHVFRNLKFYTFQDLKKNLFFDYDYKTIAFIMNYYHVSVSVAKIYLENLYFLQDINYEKVQFLLNLKALLDENHLLIYHDNFVNLFKNKKVIVYGYQVLTKEQKIILSKLHVPYELYQKDLKHYLPTIYEAKNMDDEVHFVLEEIGKLIANHIPLHHIKVIASKEYDNILNRYFSLYQIPFNKRSNHSFYSTLLAQDFLLHYDDYSIEENILRLSEKYSNVNDLVKIINRSVLVENKQLRKEFIIQDLKQGRLKGVLYDQAVNFTDLDSVFSIDDHVFLLGFNVNDYPKIQKDIDYLSDDIKEKLGLDTTTDCNTHEITSIINQIYSIKNLVITYKLSGAKGKYYPSILVSKLNVPVKSVRINATHSYSRVFSELKYACILDDLYKYNTVNENLGIYQNTLEIPYNTYNNEFTGISKELISKKLNHDITLSYTNMEMYQECAFHYYVSKILHLDIFEETFKTIIGNVMHHILELGIIRDIDIPVEIMKFVKDKGYVLNVKELFYLEKFSDDLKNILQVIRDQAKHSKLHNYLFEQEFYVYKDQDDMKVTFKGMIDKVMYTNIHDKEVLAVVDYKTGNTNITLKDLDYGLHLQLPIYLYLLKKSDRFHDDFIAGFYIQKVLPKKENIQFRKDAKALLEEKLALQGFTNSDEKLMEMIDDEYQNSKIIKNLQFKKDGQISSKSKVISNEEMDVVIEKIDLIIDEVIDHILNGDFLINPKVVDGKNVACTYCKFKDLCYKRKQNEVVLGGENN